jgi:hypothetical protein
MPIVTSQIFENAPGLGSLVYSLLRNARRPNARMVSSPQQRSRRMTALSAIMVPPPAAAGGTRTQKKRISHPPVKESQKQPIDDV